jgi:hypothetical protein
MSRRKASQNGPTIEFSVKFANGQRGRRRMQQGERAVEAPVESGSVPRVARLLALAHRMEALVRDGHVRDYAELARVGGVSRARVSQIMGLLNLAPDIQEAILCLQPAVDGRDPLPERHVRQIAAEADWDAQRRLCLDRRCPSRRTPRRVCELVRNLPAD